MLNGLYPNGRELTMKTIKNTVLGIDEVVTDAMYDHLKEGGTITRREAKCVLTLGLNHRNDSLVILAKAELTTEELGGYETEKVAGEEENIET